MARQFKSIQLSKIGGQAASRDLQWATLWIQFWNDEIEHGEGISMDIVVSKKRDMALRELEAEARTTAIAILQEALATLSDASIEQLEARAYDLE